MGLMNGVGQDRAEFAGLLWRKLFLPEPIGKIRAANEIADNVDSISGSADFQHADDIRVLQLGRRTRLAEKQLDVVLVQDVLARQLDGDESIQLRILGHPDIAEVSASQQFQQLET